MKTTSFFHWIAALFLAGIATIGAADALAQSEDSCPIYPTPRSYSPTGEFLPLGTAQTTAIVLPENPTVPNQYAGERLQSLIRNRFKVELPVVGPGSDAARNAALKFVLEVKPSAVIVDGKSRLNGFSIQMKKDGAASVISLTGADEMGLIYACEAVFSLISKNDAGTAQITAANVVDWPSIPWRGRPHSVMAHQLWPGQLETYLHGRINFVDYRDDPDQPATLTVDARKSSMGCPPGKPIDETLARRCIDEFHRRALYVFGVVSCNIKENEYPKLTQTFDELLRLGCDGIWISMDDTGGGQDPVKLARYAAEYVRKVGKTGQDVMFTPGGREYQKIDMPLNHQMAKIETFNEASWIFTRVPCKEDLEMARKIGLKSKPAWWFNFCETPYPDPKAGFIHSSAILTTQRKDGRPSYMNLQPITPGWGHPEFDKIRDAAQYTDRVNIWAVCGGWTSEYSVVMFGMWAWNPENCDWEKMQTAIYDYVWGPSQVETIRKFDALWTELKSLYFLPRNWVFRTPDDGLVRLKSPENRARALELLDQLDTLAAQLAQNAPEETAMEKDRLEYLFIEPIQTSLKFARKQATLDYPYYEFSDFEQKAVEIFSAEGEKAANEYLDGVQKKVRQQIGTLRTELAELKDIDPVLDKWEARLNNAKNIQMLVRANAEKLAKEWETLVNQPIGQFFPFMEQPSEGTVTALFDGLKEMENAQAPVFAGWVCKPTQIIGSYRVGAFNRNGLSAAAIVVPRNTKTKAGDCGWVEQTINLDAASDSFPKTAKMYLVDSRIDHRYHGVRRIDVLVNGKTVFSREVSAAVKSNWVEFPLELPADGKPSFRIVVRVTELIPVVDHTSWVFVGPTYVY
ncbi:MAG: hypothetical protein Q4A17_00330 [Thermoguttaceae bacterium]|nr:hypothetical protein [Thermoguttaceae bacterium]